MVFGSKLFTNCSVRRFEAETKRQITTSRTTSGKPNLVTGGFGSFKNTNNEYILEKELATGYKISYY